MDGDVDKVIEKISKIEQERAPGWFKREAAMQKRMAKGKVLATVWKYPCDGAMFEFRPNCYSLNFGLGMKPNKTKKGLLMIRCGCYCGNNCKPVRVRLVEEVINA